MSRIFDSGVLARECIIEMMLKKSKYFRNFIFGVEDSLVSTVGLLSGIAIVDTPKSTIILAGIVLIFVEAFSMGVGSLLSEHSAAELEAQEDISIAKSGKGALIMFFSYFFAGFIPLLPYLLLETGVAFWSSIALALITLFSLGATSGKLAHTGIFKHGIQMLVIGGIAIGLGVTVGVVVGGY